VAARYLGVDGSADNAAPSGELASAIVNGMRERRVLISATGPKGSVLKIRPPLPFGPGHADQLLTVLSDVLPAVGLGAGPSGG
jgi:4-aminobutyrate aminotransferase-like enzyme